MRLSLHQATTKAMDSTTIDEPALADAGIMDTTMDDLFGDVADGLGADLTGDLTGTLDGGLNGALSVSLPQVPLPTESILRIDELRSRGCCSKLAWANTGSIVRISEDGSRVTFHAMIRDAKAASWKISDENKHVIDAPNGRKFVHVQFSGLGMDLAIADHVGGLHMATLLGALGRMGPAPGDYQRAAGPMTELNAVVGLHFLPLFPTELRGPYLDPAVKNGEKWQVTMRNRDQPNLRAHHPAEGKHALLHITRSGVFTLLYQNEGLGWQSTSIPLEPIRSSNDLISHADICDDGADLLAITFDNASRFRLYRISISWNATQHTRGPNLNFTVVAPALQVHHLTASENIHVPRADFARLTQLRLVPVVHEAAQLGPTLPTIVAIFTHIDVPTDPSGGQQSFSIVSRWHIETLTPSLHDSFKKLKPGGDATSVLNPITVLRQQADAVLDKVVLCFGSIIYDTIFAFGTSDGGLDLRDRHSMAELHFSGDTGTVSGLPQAGFAHLTGSQNVHVAMSADGAALALFQPGGKLVGQCMAFTHGWQVVNDNGKPLVEAAAACVAREFTLLSLQNISNDEALSLLPHDATPDLKAMIVKMILRFVNRPPVDAMDQMTKQQMFILREPLVPRSLSAQLAMGTNHKTGARDAGAQFAFIMLSLRVVAATLMQTLMKPDPRVQTPETLVSLHSVIEWFTNLMIYIVQTFVEVKRTSKQDVTPVQAFSQLRGSETNVALHILLCTFTRVAIRFSLPLVQKYFHFLQGVQERARTVKDRQQISASLEMASKLPFKYHEFEKLVLEFDQAIRDAMAKNDVSADRRADLEVAMMVDGLIPTELESVASDLLETVLPKLTGSMDMSKLYFWQTEPLGIQSNRPVAGKHIDVIRKLPIATDAALRHCRHCGSVMEDLPQEKQREMPPWLLHAQRHCVCMNYWLLL
ncbi:Mediator of RNA polymerase II transcription subunit 16 [Fulvia fulva]|nr:Mediator of RNA polymerase II transcription subunit 16 [Fulvia fulva]KAK4638587.1 Mediator of RNA polymerase II transcription subunit 16 [Fulvia fulva]WPV23564.1 Mediator of RNA polymerase II transcription subunit 16 [Fulvia fulva]